MTLRTPRNRNGREQDGQQYAVQIDRRPVRHDRDRARRALENRGARAILYRACATVDPWPDPDMAAMAKMYCNEMATRVTSEAIQVHGVGTTETLKELIRIAFANVDLTT